MQIHESSSTKKCGLQKDILTTCAKTACHTGELALAMVAVDGAHAAAASKHTSETIGVRSGTILWVAQV